MNILALDLSLVSTGWADGHDFGTLTPPKHLRGAERWTWVRSHVLKLADALGYTYQRADLVVLEGYSFGSKGRALFDIAELGGIIRMTLLDHEYPYVEVPPSSLKKFATGKGNAPKDLMLVEAVKRLGYTGSDHNEADALFLWHLAANAYGLPGAVTVPKSHMETKARPAWPQIAKVA